MPGLVSITSEEVQLVLASYRADVVYSHSSCFRSRAVPGQYSTTLLSSSPLWSLGVRINHFTWVSFPLIAPLPPHQMRRSLPHYPPLSRHPLPPALSPPCDEIFCYGSTTLHAIILLPRSPISTALICVHVCPGPVFRAAQHLSAPLSL
ncbi:hypothetical protein E2C01_080359 [Portunus trituberculatus]|uniref:Uncharacterized protein n=1 Tax=Portunus trituberculatus TaxID=210409 RepID=A0A5B7IVV6_PORTR|nr:hypothetical protein [Portunus trituberculatus]